MEIFVPRGEQERRSELGELFSRFDNVRPRNFADYPYTTFALPGFSAHLLADADSTSLANALLLGTGRELIKVLLRDDSRSRDLRVATDYVEVQITFDTKYKVLRATRSKGGLVGDVQQGEASKFFGDVVPEVTGYLEDKRSSWAESLRAESTRYLDEIDPLYRENVSRVTRWLSRPEMGAVAAARAIDGEGGPTFRFFVSDLAWPTVHKIDKNFELFGDSFLASRYVVENPRKGHVRYEATFDNFGVDVQVGAVFPEDDFEKYLDKDVSDIKSFRESGLTLLWADPKRGYPVFG